MIDRIKKIMEVEGLSMGKFANEIGIINSRLSLYLSGQRNVSLEFVTKILEKLSLFPRFLECFTFGKSA